MADRLPFFAYGTLLPGQPNYWLWGEAIRDLRPAKLAGCQLLDMGNYPMLIEGGDREVKGALVTIRTSSYGEILGQLDRLEGFDPANSNECIYRRVKRIVYLEDVSAAPAWLYLGSADAAGAAPVIDSGDWASYSASMLHDMVAWWESQGPEL
jgi:gamma-glutamylcyclotransferase (GGCT)/AIG2-like uncharacterized protein YtfP